MGSNEGQPFTEDPLGTRWNRAKKPSDRHLQPHGNALPRQIACPAAIVTMDAPRWRLTPRADGLLSRADCIHSNVLWGSLNGGDTYGWKNSQKMRNVHAAIYSSHACPHSSALRKNRIIDALPTP